MLGDTYRLYPDLVAAGGLGNAIQATLVAIGSKFRVSPRNGSINFAAYAMVEFGSRLTSVHTVANERSFSFSCSNRGVLLAYGQTQRLDELARAIDHWLGSDCTVAEMAAAFGYVAPEACAEVYERGEEVEDRRLDYLANLGERHPEFVRFVHAAAGRPELRCLFPFTSMKTFCFSRCTGYPFTRDTPHVRPLPSGEYEVVGPGDHVLGRGNEEAAAMLVVRHLPPGCGRAVAGTAEDLAKAESGAAVDTGNP